MEFDVLPVFYVAANVKRFVEMLKAVCIFYWNWLQTNLKPNIS